MKIDSDSEKKESVSKFKYYRLMKNSFEIIINGNSRNLSKSEVDACYDWRIANILIKDTFESSSTFSFEEWESFVNSCGKGKGLSNRKIKNVEEKITKICQDILTDGEDLWKSSEERRRHIEAMERLNGFLIDGSFSPIPA